MRWLSLIIPMLVLGASPSAAEFRAYGQIEEIRDGQRAIFATWDISGASGAGDGKSSLDGAMIRMTGSSLADIGGLRASSSAAVRELTANQTLGADTSRSAISVAVGTYEVTITGPSGPVTTSFDMELGGTLAVVSANTLVDLNAASSGLGLVFRVNGAVLTPGQNPHSSGDYGISNQAGGPIQTITYGALDDWVAPLGTITSLPFMVQAGTPFTLEITLVATASVNADAAESGFTASGNADFGSTLRFPTGVPVFDLPAGYSASSPDAGIVDNEVPCTENCTRFQSKCDAAKFGCIAKRQACLLKVHAAAEKKGVALDDEALQKCVDTFGACIGKLESKQNPAKPKTLCSATGDLVALSLAGDGFVTDVVTAIDPSFPTVGPPSVCDGGKKVCVAQRAACQLKVAANATKKGVPIDPAVVQTCTDKFDGGAKGFAKGCLGKLQAKQDVEKPKTVCAVTDDGTALAARVDAFVDETLGAVLNVDLE